MAAGPKVRPQMVGSPLRIRYIKVNDRRHFRPNHHCYAADELVAIEDNTVCLGELRDVMSSSRNSPSRRTPRASNGPYDGPLVAEIIHGTT